MRAPTEMPFPYLPAPEVMRALTERGRVIRGLDSFFKWLAFLELTNTDPFAERFVVTGDASPDGIRVVQSVLGAISFLPIVAFRE